MYPIARGLFFIAMVALSVIDLYYAHGYAVVYYVMAFASVALDAIADAGPPLTNCINTFWWLGVALATVGVIASAFSVVLL